MTAEHMEKHTGEQKWQIRLQIMCCDMVLLAANVPRGSEGKEEEDVSQYFM